MLKKLNYIWRLIGTGIGFTYIFFGGAILALLSRLVPFHSRERTQKFIRMFFRAYINMLQFFGIISLSIEGKENIDKSGRILIANHPSLLDVVILMSLIPNAQCIVKHELWAHPLLGPLMRRAGYISNNLEGESLVAECKKAFKKNQCLILFPEGTRTIPGSLVNKFQRGFANLALFTQIPIQRVVITCNPPTLVKGDKWWHIPPRKPLFKLLIEKPLDAAYYIEYNKQNRGIAARHLVKDMENYYSEKLKNG